MKNQKSVAKFIILFLGIGIISFAVIIAFFVNYGLHRELNKYFEDQLSEQSIVVTEEINYTLKKTEQTARWVQSSFLKEYEEKGYDIELVNTVSEYANTYFDAENIVFFDERGVSVSSPKFGVVPNLSLISRALNGEEISIFDKTGARIFATVILPLKNQNQEIFGAVEIRTAVSTDELLETVSKYAHIEMTIFHESVAFLSTIDSMQGTEISDPEILANCKVGSSTIKIENLFGTKYISYYYPLFDQNGKFLATILLNREMSFVAVLISAIFIPLTVIIIIFTIITLILTAFIIHNYMIKPLRNIKNAVANLSSGDADLTARIQIDKNDEFGQVASEVNKFIEMLHQIIIDLDKSQKVLNSVGNELGTNAQESASATAQILANIESIRRQTENQSSSVQNTSKVLNSSSVVVNELSSLIEEQTAGITESSAAIEQMLGNISNVTKSVNIMSDSYNELRHTVDEGQIKLSTVNTKVQEISEQSKMLLKANAIIAQIASETNLLAMNAAIEAAHAGEAGKGFSVVADEIRTLAENSSSQSKNISKELQNITNSIEGVVNLSSDSQKAFIAIVEQISSTNKIISEITNAMDEQQLASKQIFEALSQIKDQSLEVSDKSKMMNRGIVDVSNDMSSVIQVSTTIQGSMDEMTAGMQQIGSATQNVSSLATETSTNINAMNQKITLFKV